MDRNNPLRLFFTLKSTDLHDYLYRAACYAGASISQTDVSVERAPRLQHSPNSTMALSTNFTAAQQAADVKLAITAQNVA